MERLFDELNVSQKKISVPYEEYFSDMELTKEQREERVKFSYEFEDIMLFILALASVMVSYGYINEQYIKNELNKRYSEMVRQYINIDDYVNDYIRSFSDDVINTTMKHEEDEWYFSNDRAMLISENEANTILNNSDFAKAVESGKTKKKWMDIRDKRERKTHLRVGGTVYSPQAKETVNCRCSIKYY